jgi:hypothetical protein
VDCGRRRKIARAKARTVEATFHHWLRERGELPQRAFGTWTIGELLQYHLDEQASEIHRLRGQLEQKGQDPDLEARIRRMERLFSGFGDELQDLESDEQLDFDKAYYTGDPVVDALERQFAKTGEVPDF